MDDSGREFVALPKFRFACPCCGEVLQLEEAEQRALVREYLAEEARAAGVPVKAARAAFEQSQDGTIRVHPPRG